MGDCSIVVVGTTAAPTAPSSGETALEPSRGSGPPTSLDKKSSSNPLMTGDQFPQWGNIKPEHVTQAVKQLLSEEGAALDLLEQDLKRAGKNVTFNRIFLPYTQIQLRMDGVLGQISHLSVSTCR
jgi:Zn-dependent oligopeptidase